MYAIVGTSDIDASRGEEATQLLTNGLLPGISQAPGFVSATIVRSADGTGGRSMVVFETEEAAKAVAARAPEMMPADSPITLVSLEIMEVVASG